LRHSLNQNTKIEPYHNIPCVLTVHDVNFVEEKSNNISREHNIRFQKKPDRSNAITYISRYAKMSTHMYFEIPKVPEFVIYNGNPISEIKISEDYEPIHRSKCPFLFFIGEFTEHKNIYTLVQMLEYLLGVNFILSEKMKPNMQIQLENQL
jgi:glycosyltransferase involved in cell wall biosynthesis